MGQGNGSTRRGLLLLGAILGALALTGGLPWITREATRELSAETPALTGTVHVLACVVLPAALALLTLASTRAKPGSRLYPCLFWFAGAVVLGTQVQWVGIALFSVGRGGSLLLLSYVGWFLQAFAGPALLGTAITLRENPGSARLQKSFRVAAGGIQLGFVFIFVGYFRELAYVNSLSNSQNASSAVYALHQISLLAERLLLLWASIQALRTAAEESVVRLRARQIQRLMFAWIGCVALSDLLQTIYYSYLNGSGNDAPSAPLGLLHLALEVTATLVAALAWASRPVAPDPTPTPAPAP